MLFHPTGCDGCVVTKKNLNSIRMRGLRYKLRVILQIRQFDLSTCIDIIYVLPSHMVAAVPEVGTPGSFKYPGLATFHVKNTIRSLLQGGRHKGRKGYNG